MSKNFVNKLSYLDYSTIYSSNNTIKLSLSSHACFADLINRQRLQDEHYEVLLVRDPKYALEQHRANLCFFNEADLRKHLGLARRLFPFKYSIEETMWRDKYPSFKVIIDMNASHFYHRYLLTWIRYAYEFPYNLILMDALRLKKDYLKKVSITNLFVLCANTYSGGPLFYGSGHSISKLDSQFLKEQELRDKISSLAATKFSGLNDIYPRSDRSFVKLPNVGENHFLEYWIDFDEFKTRVKYYLDNYKLMIK